MNISKEAREAANTIFEELFLCKGFSEKDIAQIIQSALDEHAKRYEEVVRLLKQHHAHQQQSLIVSFFNEETEDYTDTDLGEAYSESDLCEKTIEALSLATKFLEEWK